MREAREFDTKIYKFSGGIPMKLKLKWIAPVLGALLLFTGCSGITQEEYDAAVEQQTSLAQEESELQVQKSRLEEEKEGIEAIVVPEREQREEMRQLRVAANDVGQAFEFASFTITIESWEFQSELESGYWVFKPSDGKQLLVVTMTVKNNSDESQKLGKMIGGNSMGVVYDDSKFYSYSMALQASKDLSHATFSAQEEKTGYILVDLPAEIAQADGNLVFRFIEESGNTTVAVLLQGTKD